MSPKKAKSAQKKAVKKAKTAKPKKKIAARKPAPKKAAPTKPAAKILKPVTKEELIEKAKQQLGIEMGQTTKDGAITLEICRCVGACSQAPVVVVDEDVNGRVKPNKLPQMLRKCQTQ